MMSCRRKMRRPGRCIFVCVFSFTAFLALAMLTSRDLRSGQGASESFSKNNRFDKRGLSQPIQNVPNVDNIEKRTFDAEKKSDRAARFKTGGATRSSRTLKDVGKSDIKSMETQLDFHGTTLLYQTTGLDPNKTIKSIREHFEDVKKSLQKIRNSTEGGMFSKRLPADLESRHQPIDGGNVSKPCVRIGVLAGVNAGRWNGSYSCPETACVIDVTQSFQTTLLREAQAVFFPHSSLHMVDFGEIGRSRSPNQLWIFMSFESPIHTTRLSSRWARFGFNWTFTYRTDATFPSPYGRYMPGKPVLAENDTTNWARGKTKFAAWIGSNCHNTGWPRFDFVNRLQKFMPLDTFGSCGTKTCPRNPKCGDTLIKYKFYFALENSNCKDYITEKFWEAPFKNNLIPVVYGPPREDYEKVAPPKSFIHVDDFRTMSELADYLKLLDSNDTLYNEYFKWKQVGSVESGLIGNYYHSRKVMCRIAPRIKEIQEAGRVTSESELLDMKTWWADTCHGKSPSMMNSN